MQSCPTGTPRIRAISGVTLAPGGTPPRPGLAPWLSLISTARIESAATVSLNAWRSNRPAESRQAEVAGADLPDQLASLEVIVGDAPLARVLQAVRELRAAIQRLDCVRAQRAEASSR